VKPEPELGPWARGWRAARRRGHQAARLLRWAVEPQGFPPPLVASGRAGFPHRVFEARVPLFGPSASGEPLLEEGKRTNVALAAPAFDGVVVTPWRPLSFWRAVGHPGRAAGFRAGVEILGGCLVPSTGGGLCLLSNTLFAMAARLGWTILERHGHSAAVARALPGDPPGLDATVLWPYLDLRAAPRAGAARLSVSVRAGVLEVAVDADRPPAVDVALAAFGARDVRQGGQLYRESRVMRTVRERGGGRVQSAEVVARSRQRVTEGPGHARTCLGCGERSCATGLIALRRMGRG
jgi:vancomycin resistance protein VanW